MGASFSRKIFNIKAFTLSIVSSFLLTASIFLNLDIFKKLSLDLQYYFLLFSIIFVLTIIMYFLWKYIIPKYDDLHTQHKVILIFCGLFSFIVLVVIPASPRYIYSLLPTHQLEIMVIGEGSPDQSSIRIKIPRFETEIGKLELSSITSQGEWLVRNDTYISHSDGVNSLLWQGKTGARALLVIKCKSTNTILRILWDGADKNIDCDSQSYKKVKVSRKFDAPIGNLLLGYGITWIAVGLITFLLTVFLLSFQSGKSMERSHPRLLRWGWIVFALPMMVSWSIYLLTFWPGLMSPDSIDQWGQVLSGHFNDWHPAILTMLIWFLTRMWESPAIIGITQIILISLLVAWGLKELLILGVGSEILWVLAVLYALLPVNGYLVISYWKDIPYAAGLFALFIIFIKIVFTDGVWLKRYINLAGLILASTCIGLFRHNGFPVAFISLIILGICYRSYWRYTVSATLVSLVLWLTIRGPFYDLLEVSKPQGTGNIVFLHHIGAHIKSRTYLEPKEKAYLETIQPVASWPYACCTIDPTIYNNKFNKDVLDTKTNRPWQIALNLFMRNPAVDFKHMMCSSSIVLKIITECDTAKVPIGVNNGTITWIASNDFGVKESSLAPQLVPFFSKLAWADSLYWKPAVYLLLSLFCISILAIRIRSWRYLFPCIPILLQTGIMITINIAQDFRYMYSVCLIGVFCLALFFIPDQFNFHQLE